MALLYKVQRDHTASTLVAMLRFNPAMRFPALLLPSTFTLLSLAGSRDLFSPLPPQASVYLSAKMGSWLG